MPPKGIPSEEEHLALQVVCAMENVTHYEWIPSGDGSTPDLHMVLDDSRFVTVEITISTIKAIRDLYGAVEKFPRFGANKLSHRWHALIADPDIAYRKKSRRIKELVEAMVSVLRRVEAQGGTPEDMTQRANEALDYQECRPYRLGRGWWSGPFGEAQPWAGTLSAWVREHLSEHCDYWYPLDMLDWQLDRIEPRHVQVVILPVPSGGGNGGIEVAVSPSEHAVLLTGMDYLVPAIQKAIDHKKESGQMDDAQGKKWLLVPLDTHSNAAMQLERVFGPQARTPYPQMSELRLFPFDEVWVFAETFHRNGIVVIRLSESGNNPAFLPIDSLDHDNNPSKT